MLVGRIVGWWVECGWDENVSQVNLLLCRLEELSTMQLNGSRWLPSVTSVTSLDFARKEIYFNLLSIYGVQSIPNELQ